MQNRHRACFLSVDINLVPVNFLPCREQIDAPRDVKRAHSNHSLADKQGRHRILEISEVVVKFPPVDIRVDLGFAEASGVDRKHDHPRCHQLLRLRR